MRAEDISLILKYLWLGLYSVPDSGKHIQKWFWRFLHGDGSKGETISWAIITAFDTVAACCNHHSVLWHNYSTHTIFKVQQTCAVPWTSVAGAIHLSPRGVRGLNKPRSLILSQRFNWNADSPVPVFIVALRSWSINGLFVINLKRGG